MIEALDLIENNKKNKSVKCNVFAVLKIADENGVELKNYNTETRPYYVSDTLVIGEEFIFENVSSAHSLVVSFYSLSLSVEKSPPEVAVLQNCLGFTQIPLSRLEENRPVRFFLFS